MSLLVDGVNRWHVYYFKGYHLFGLQIFCQHYLSVCSLAKDFNLSILIHLRFWAFFFIWLFVFIVAIMLFFRHFCQSVDVTGVVGCFIRCHFFKRHFSAVWSRTNSLRKVVAVWIGNFMTVRFCTLLNFIHCRFMKDHASAWLTCVIFVVEWGVITPGTLISWIWWFRYGWMIRRVLIWVWVYESGVGHRWHLAVPMTRLHSSKTI